MRKRHEVDRQRLELWSSTFDSGWDFFSELEPLGVIDPVRASEEEEGTAERAFLGAARDAWLSLARVSWKPGRP